MELWLSILLLISSLSNIDLIIAVEENSIWAHSKDKNGTKSLVEEDEGLLPCEAVCYLLDEGETPRKEDELPRSYNGSAKVEFHHCPTLQCLRNQATPCFVGCNCVQDHTLRYKVSPFFDIDGRSKHRWHLNEPALHCQNLKAWLGEASIYLSWRLQEDKEKEEEISSSLNHLPNALLSSSLKNASLNIRAMDFANEKMNLTMIQNKLSPPAAFFFIEIRGENSGWQFLDKTNKTFLAVEGLKFDTLVQICVRAFDADGMKIGQPATSQWIRTVTGNMKPKSVQKIWVTNIKLEEHRASIDKKSLLKINAEISWTSSEDKLCYYDIAWFYKDGYRVKKNRKPENAYQALLEDLEYSASYNVSVTAVVVGKHEKDGEIDRESGNTSICFTTPSCTEMWNNNLRICRPPTPENITYEMNPKSDAEDEHIYDLKVAWSLPSYATSINGLMHQYVQVEVNAYPVINTFDVQPVMDYDWNSTENIIVYEKNVSADSYMTIFHSVLLNSDFGISIKCESEGGYSDEAYRYVKLPQLLPVAKYYATIEHELLITVMILLFLLILSTTLIIFIVRWCGNHSFKHKTCHYFEAEDKVKVGDNDVSEAGAMLGRQIPGTEQEHNSSEWASGRVETSDAEMEKGDEDEADEFEISLDRLVIREFLGEGAFGVVRKGYYSHHGFPNRVYPVDHLTPTNSPLWETVAVKMLREDASAEEEKQLIHEMETLKSLGRCSHPNVVSLVGCYTEKIKNKKTNKNTFRASNLFGISHSESKPRLLLLVEHCALGDLQNFLQNVWKESGGLIPNQIRNEFTPTGDKCVKEIEMKEIKYINEILPKKNYKGNLKYADLDHSSSKEDCDTESRTVIGGVVMTNHTYGMPSESNEDSHESKEAVDSSILSPAYLLSYARQIAMGMEYLSGQKVVHRDLAARNILLCEDACTVKISDFGMSRDIYLQNMYHKASAHEKLPIKWMALEALLHQVYSTQSDVWSFGILLWEIVTLGGTPYPGIATSEVFKLLQCGYRMERPENCSTELYQLMCWSWKEKPSERPTFSQLRIHLENLLQQNSASTYLTLPGYPFPMVTCSSEGDSQISTSSENSSEKYVNSCKNERQPCFTHVNNNRNSSKHIFHPENHSSSSIRKTSSNASFRHEKTNDKSEISFERNTDMNEGTDYLKPIPVCVEQLNN